MRSLVLGKIQFDYAYFYMWVPSGLQVHFAFMGVYVLGRQYASVLAAHVELQSGVARGGR